jgi:hypothetical protein
VECGASYNSRDRPLANTLFNLILDRNTSLKDNRKQQNSYNVDQVFLANVVYPLIFNNSVVHDSYFCKICNDNALQCAA